MSNHTINLIPIRNGGVFKEWRMSMNGGPEKGPGHYDPVVVAKGDTATMTFKIRNPQGITFKPFNLPDSPIYIPKTTVGVDSQFMTPVVASSGPDAGTKLTVPDSNQTAGQYAYVLNFNGAPPLDPIVDNGGPGRSAAEYAFIALGIFAVAALAILILRPMMRRRQQNR